MKLNVPKNVQTRHQHADAPTCRHTNNMYMSQHAKCHAQTFGSYVHHVENAKSLGYWQFHRSITPL
jgi:hypothetical protein